jgi:hypothetical protein
MAELLARLHTGSTRPTGAARGRDQNPEEAALMLHK